MRSANVTIRVEFPALDRLVQYLKDRDAQQPAIDAMTVKVAELTERLSQTSTGLESAVGDNQ